jgi:hypothetical protein
MLRGLFARRAGVPERDRDATDRIRDMASALLSAPPGTEITVSEIVCLDPACPGTETVVLVMRAGRKTQAAKVPRPARNVEEAELRAALLEAGFEVPA